MADGSPETAGNYPVVMGGRDDLGLIDAQAPRIRRSGSRVGRRAPIALGSAIGALLVAATAAALNGVGGSAALQLVGAAHAATVTHRSGSAASIAAGFRLERGDIVSTGATGGVTLDAGANRLFVGPSSSVVVDSPASWTLRSGQVGLARSTSVSPQVPVVLAGSFSVVAAPGSGVRIQRAGTVQAAALRGTASVRAGGQSVHLATLREVNLAGTAVSTVPQLVQSLDDSADGVDAQLAPELIALDTALTRLATQVGADPRAAELFGTGPLSAGEVALEDALQRLAGPQIALVSAGSSGRIAWGVLATQAGANDAQVRAYVGAVLDGTTPAPAAQPAVGTQTATAPYAATAPAAANSAPADHEGSSAAAPSRDSGTGDSGASAAPPAPVAAATSPPAAPDSAAPSAAPTTADQPTTDAPTTADQPTTDAPTTDAPTTDPATTPAPDAAPDGVQAAPQTAPQAGTDAAVAGPLGMLVVLARGMRGPGSSPTPSPRSGPGASVTPKARPGAKASPTARAATPRGAPTPTKTPAPVPAGKALPTSKKAVPIKAPSTGSSAPAVTRKPVSAPTSTATRAAVPTVSPTTPPAPKPGATKAPSTSAVPTKAPVSTATKPGPIAALVCPVLGPSSLCGRTRSF